MKDRIIEVASKDFVTDVDGYIYWWPSGNGHWNSVGLRIIADELDQRNAEWEIKISEGARPGESDLRTGGDKAASVPGYEKPRQPRLRPKSPCESQPK